MSSTTTNASSRRRVHFDDEANHQVYEVIPTCWQAPAHFLWYHDYAQLRRQARRPIAAWKRAGFDQVLLTHTYQKPCVNVQDHLHAHCRMQLDKGQDSMRGVELLAGGTHAQERQECVRKHRQCVLEAYHTNTSGTNHDDDERVASVSRQCSAPSRLFAMRMGRADARVVQLGDSNEPALELLAAQAQEEQVDPPHYYQPQPHYQRRRRHAPQPPLLLSPETTTMALPKSVMVDQPKTTPINASQLTSLPHSWAMRGGICVWNLSS